MMTVNLSILNSRFVSKNSGRHQVVPNQAADVMITRKGTVHSLIYLPLEHHIKNPQYIGYKLETVQKESKDARVYVIVLNEIPEGAKHCAQVQAVCLKRNVNMMMCFDIQEAKELIDVIFQF